MAKRRVVITGLGCVTPIGRGREAFWKAACEGRSGVSLVTRFDTTGFEVRIAGWLPDFDPQPVITPRDARRIDRYAQFALVAADEAVRDSGLELAREDRDRLGCIIGSGIGGLQEMEEQKAILLQRGPDRVSPFLIPKMMANSAGGLIGIQFGLRGPNCTVLTACASSSHAIGDAYFHIAYGMADVVLTGGAEATITPLGLAGFIACKALSKRNDEPARASRPFDRERDGFVMGEGGGILVFEELEHARARGARIYAEVLGFGATCDAHHITAPEPEGDGAARSMSTALRDAGLRPTDVSYINAHGTSTPLNDAMETRAIKRTFGDHAYKLAINSTKSMIGHLLGASGGVELVQTALSVAHDVVPPTINYENPDPECDLDYVPNTARELPVRVAMCNSFGFGGHNASILIGKLR
ncbi:MAG TPA: beta-ketoacyl-ACP synthase II [Planctomycetota bacterium]|nr:beta-ketoacyl-ACP synthase II [Planctomycetota bacterium]HRR79983.1 beta-ketoacyl-ACP synthase II [Planctomycetota bacterium]HRT94588.1 beta-ketoacyl-ACP synthase II [Planctomycetota bacterium]